MRTLLRILDLVFFGFIDRQESVESRAKTISHYSDTLDFQISSCLSKYTFDLSIRKGRCSAMLSLN
jgi:hypothetical protein